MSVMSPSGPIMHRVDVTTFSRSGSSGGFVTCNRMGKILHHICYNRTGNLQVSLLKTETCLETGISYVPFQTCL